MYDLITRVPMVVWAPGMFEGGRSIDGLCQHMDIGPALMELAGLEVPDSLEAQSLLPALKGESWTPRDYVYAEQIKDGILTETEFMSMIRNREWKMVHFLGMTCGQLFNLAEDPDETRNLWDHPEAQEVKRKLLDQLLEWHIESQIDTQGWASEWR
jgi:arylsulfatase A-like enzyme